MGIFSKYEIKHKLGKSGTLVLAKYPAGGYDLIRNGKVIEKNLITYSRNIVRQSPNDNSEVFWIKTRDGQYKIYSIEDGSVVLEGLKPIKTDEVEIIQQKHEIVVDFGYGKWLVNTRDRAISEDYEEVGDPDENGFRRVKQLNGGIDPYYYVNSSAVRATPNFTIEKYAGEDERILRIKSKDSEYFKDHIWSKRGDFMSVGFDTLDYVGGRFLASEIGKYFFVDHNGERQTENIENYELLNNGTLITSSKKQDQTIVYGRDYGFIVVLKKAVVDRDAGVIVGDTVAGKTVMLGYDAKKIVQVDPVASRLIVGRMKNGVLNDRLVNKAYLEQIEIGSTYGVYEEIINQNLAVDKRNKTLKWISQNGRELLSTELYKKVELKKKRIRVVDQDDGCDKEE